MKQKSNSNKSTSRKKSKASKKKEKSVPVLGKAGTKPSHIDKALQKNILDLLDGIAPPEWIEKLKAKIENLLNNNTRSTIRSTQKPNFINYREPVPAIPDSEEEEETLDDPMEIDFV